jgi:hypothetical protein
LPFLPFLFFLLFLLFLLFLPFFLCLLDELELSPELSSELSLELSLELSSELSGWEAGGVVVPAGSACGSSSRARGGGVSKRTKWTGPGGPTGQHLSSA